jgi:gliding motility-associated-like protein
MKKLWVFLGLLFAYEVNAQINLAQGLVLYLPFTGNTLDASGNGNHAANSGATLTTDEAGTPNSAYYFDGSGDFMTISNNIQILPSSMTICAKVQPKAFYAGPCFNNVIMAKGDDCGSNAGDFGLTYTPTLNQNPSNFCQVYDSLHENYRCYIDISGAAGSLAVITPTNGVPYIQTNKWDCVIGVFDNTTNIVRLYVNGIMRYSYTAYSFFGNNEPIYLGKQNYPNYEYWLNATLDEVRLYNRALNTSEIDSICNYQGGVIIDTTDPSLDTVTASFIYDSITTCFVSNINFYSTSTFKNSSPQSYYWLFGDGTTSNVKVPNHSYGTPGTYKVTLIATNNLGTSDTFINTITVTNTTVSGDAIISIPNAFSPNGDKHNACFKVLSNTPFTTFSLLIFNRWGEKVFETKDPSACWNGDQKNRIHASSETFYYLLNAKTACEDVIRKGDITILD